VRLLHYLMLLLIAVSVVISLQTVGVALMIAMLVTPAATAYLLVRRLPVLMAALRPHRRRRGRRSACTSPTTSTWPPGPPVVLVCTGLLRTGLPVQPATRAGVAPAPALNGPHSRIDARP
jgi:hypothetical protein